MKKTGSKLKKTLGRSGIPLIVGLVALVAIGGAILWMKEAHRHDTKVIAPSASNIDHSPATPQDNASNDARKSSPNPAATLDNGPTSSGVTPLAATIVSANVNNGYVHVGTLVSGVTSGSCELIATQAGQQSVTRTANVRKDVNNYDCGIFNLATSDFPKSGRWTLTLTVTSNGQQASNSTTIDIQA